MLKVGARYYDPEFGCFLTRDTNLTQSPYAYCGGDPVNRADPSGHSWFSQFFNAVVGIVKTVVNYVVNTVKQDLTAIAEGKFEDFIYWLISPTLGTITLQLFGQSDLAYFVKGLVAGAISGYVTAKVDGANQLQSILLGSLYYGVYAESPEPVQRVPPWPFPGGS